MSRLLVTMQGSQDRTDTEVQVSTFFTAHVGLSDQFLRSKLHLG